jgi:hypothetical protein
VGTIDLKRRSTSGRPDGHDYVFVAAAIGTLVLLPLLGAGMTFFSDEWAFIQTRTLGDPVSWLPPHNEHWATVPIVVYRLLVETVGLVSYVHYLALLAAVHVTVAALVYTMVRQSAGKGPAVAAGLLVLFLGSGFENLFWAFQIGFLGSIAAGLGALIAFERPSRRRVALGVVLVLTSLASSGIGLVFAFVVAMDLVLDPKRRLLVTTLNVPAIAYALWYVTFGRLGISGQRNPLSLSAAADVPGFVTQGLQSAAGAVTGLGAGLGFIGLSVIAIVVAWQLATEGRSGISPRFVSCALGIIAMYILIGLVRAQLFSTVAQYTRYTYVAAVLLVVALGALLGRVGTPSSVRSRRVVLVLAGIALGAAFSWNIRLLAAGRGVFLDRADLTRSLIIGAMDPARPPHVDPRGVIAAEIQRYGSPLNDVLVPWAVRPIPPAVAAATKRRLASGEIAPPVVP